MWVTLAEDLNERINEEFLKISRKTIHSTNKLYKYSLRAHNSDPNNTHIHEFPFSLPQLRPPQYCNLALRAARAGSRIFKNGKNTYPLLFYAEHGSESRLLISALVLELHSHDPKLSCRRRKSNFEARYLG